MKSITLGFILTALLLSTSARADVEDAGSFYAALGASKISIDLNQSSFEQNATAPEIRLGYMLSSSFGVELGYHDLGDYSNPLNDLDLNAYSASVIANIPLSNFDIYGKFGATAFSGDLRLGDQTLSHDSDINLHWGAGAELDFGSFNLFTEYSQTRFNHGLSDIDVNRITAGIKLELHR